MYYQNGQRVGTPVRRANGKTHIHRTARSYLVCNNARRRHQCDNKGRVRYEILEPAILNFLVEVFPRGLLAMPGDVSNDPLSILRNEMADLERRTELTIIQLDNAIANLQLVRSRSLSAKAAQLENEIDELNAHVEQVRLRIEVEENAPSSEDALASIGDLHASLTSTDEGERYSARVKTHQALRQLVKKMWCNRDGSVHMIVGNNALFLRVEADGEISNLTYLNVVYQGPDGQSDWHPDDDERMTGSD
jgi:hypothetical protein